MEIWEPLCASGKPNEKLQSHCDFSRSGNLSYQGYSVKEKKKTFLRTRLFSKRCGSSPGEGLEQSWLRRENLLGMLVIRSVCICTKMRVGITVFKCFIFYFFTK